MTTTESVSTPQTTWSGVDVLYLAPSGTDATVTLWTIPAAPSGAVAPDALRAVAKDHAAAVAAAGDGEPDDLTEHPDGYGGTYLTRGFTSPGDGSAMAAYFASQGGIAVAMARDPAGSDLTRHLAELVAADRPRFLLTAEDVLVLADAAELAVPPLSPTAYPPDASDEVRRAAHLAARGGLLARGLVVAEDERVVPVADLGVALTLLLDGDRMLLVSKVGVGGHSTALLGGRDGVVATLGPAGPGLLELTTGSAGQTVARWAEWLTEGVAAHAGDAQPFTARLADVQSCLGSSDGPEQLRAARAKLSVRGLRRHGDDTASFDAAWVEDASRRLWSVSAADDLESAVLAPAVPRDIGDSLAGALDFSAP